MRFGLVHRVMTDALATLGVTALVVSGQFSPTVSLVLLGGMAVAIALSESQRRAASKRHLDTMAPVLLVAVQLGRAFLTEASGVDLLIEFAVGLQIIRVATRKGAAHDQQVIVLALLHLIAGTVVGGGLAYGLCFLGLLVVTPGALVLRHLRREVEGNYRQGARDRTGLPVDVPRILRSKRVVGRQFIAVTCLLAGPILLFTAVLFVAFPRVGLSLMLLSRPKSGRMIGFSGKVDLGQIGTLRSDPSIALRVTMPELPAPPPPRLVMHLRGTALDAYDGRTWSQTVKQNSAVAADAALVLLGEHRHTRDKPTMLVELEPLDPPVLFLPPNAQGVRIARGPLVTPANRVTILRGPEGELRYHSASDRGLRYQVFTAPDEAPSFGGPSSEHRARYLQLPDLPPRIGELAEAWTRAETTDHGRALAIERHLRSEYRYDLSSPSGGYPQPLDHFLFESKRGHCEYYSTAMAVMLRHLDIPSRNVAGFVGGTWNRFGGFYAVRQGDAHSWVEAYIAGRGWLTFDPTPPGAAIPQSEIYGAFAYLRDFVEAVSQRWNRHVVGYDLQQQVDLLDSLESQQSLLGQLASGPRRRTLLALAGAALAAACTAWWWRRRRRRRGASGERPDRASESALLATRLYQLLDRTMARLGIARAAGTPPLRHAEQLRRAEHPLAAEILGLTERYLVARFGELPLSPGDQRDFERRVRKLRDRLAAASATAATAPQSGPTAAAQAAEPASRGGAP